MRFRRVAGAGVSLAVWEWGDVAQPTVVLVHGYPDSSALWRPVAESLAPRFHVVAYDVRGAGESEAPPGRAGYRLPLLVDDLFAVIDATAGGRPVHLVAHDWGSVQCWEAVLSGPLEGRVATYTSISGPPLDHVGRWVRRRLRTGPRRPVAAQLARSSYIWAMHTPGVPWMTRRVAAGVRRLRPRSTAASDFANGMNLYTANVMPRLLRPASQWTDVPVQLVVPTKDRFVPPALLEGLESSCRRLRRQEIVAGHWVPRDHPAALAELVVDWIEACASDS